MDPNILACKESEDLLEQLIDSGAYVEFNQGLDIRLMTEHKAELIKKIKIGRMIHFAWDNYEDGEIIVPKLKMFQEITGWDKNKMSVYLLTNYNTTLEQDLERIYTLRDLKYHPDVRVYDKSNLPKGHVILKLQRWCNNPWVFYTCNRFEDYKR